MSLQLTVLFSGLFLWSIGDLVTTFVGLSSGLVEVNPFFSWVTINDFWFLVLIKFVGLIVVLLVVGFMYLINFFHGGWVKRFGDFSIFLVSFFFLFIGSWVVVHNLVLIM